LVQRRSILPCADSRNVRQDAYHSKGQAAAPGDSGAKAAGKAAKTAAPRKPSATVKQPAPGGSGGSSEEKSTSGSGGGKEVRRPVGRKGDKSVENAPAAESDSRPQQPPAKKVKVRRRKRGGGGERMIDFLSPRFVSSKAYTSSVDAGVCHCHSRRREASRVAATAVKLA
jgi:hypothetical protein